MRKTLCCWLTAALIGLLAVGLCAEEAPVPPEGLGATAVEASDPGPAVKLRRLDLDEAVRMGLKANLSIRAGAYTPRMAESGWRASAAIFDPVVSAGLEYAHDEAPIASAFFGSSVWRDKGVHAEAGISQVLRSGGTVSFLYTADRLDTNALYATLNPSWTQGARINATQPLLRGAGDVVMTDMRLAHNDVLMAREDQKALVQEVLLEVVRAYWELVYAQDLVVARLKSEDVAAELLRDARARLGAKIGTPLDVAEAVAGLEGRRGNRIGAEGLRGAAQDMLRALILPFSRSTVSSVTLVASDDVTDTQAATTPDASQLDQYVEMALANRPEMRASKTGLLSRNIDMFAAANAVKPQLDLIARVGTGGLDAGYGTSFESMLSGDALSAAVGVGFSMFIGQRQARANLRLAEWARRQAVVIQKDLENLIVAEVRAGVRDVGIAMAVQAAGAEEVKAAKQGLQGEERRRANGKSTPFRVLQKEDVLTDARTRWLRAGVDRRIAEASFWRAVGLLTETLGAREP